MKVEADCARRARKLPHARLSPSPHATAAARPNQHFQRKQRSLRRSADDGFPACSQQSIGRSCDGASMMTKAHAASLMQEALRVQRRDRDRCGRRTQQRRSQGAEAWPGRAHTHAHPALGGANLIGLPTSQAKRLENTQQTVDQGTEIVIASMLGQLFGS